MCQKQKRSTNIIKRYRSEWKYLEKEAKLIEIKNLVSAVLERDEHAGLQGKYGIHSLYFDDYKDSSARENVAGEAQRFKYRIRYYDEDSTNLWLEKKEKLNSFCHKRQCRITKQQYDALLHGRHMEVFWNTDNKLLREFCLDICNKQMQPVVIIDYEREAFVEKITNIRITFDYNISASDKVDGFLDGEYIKYPIMEKGYHVLEVKFDEILPSFIKNILQSDTLIQQAMSKYYIGRTTLQKHRKWRER